MPNLVSSVDVSEYYTPDINLYYQFDECEIDNPDYKLKYVQSKLNGEQIHIYLLTDKNENHLSVLRLVEKDIKDKVYHQINKSYSIIPQKGYGEILYHYCFQIHNVSIISDNLNTLPGSFNLWRKIIKKQNPNVYKIDIKNNRSSKLNLPLNEFLIWGVNDDFLEAIMETPWQAVIFENEYEDPAYDNDDFEDDNHFVDYLSENDKIERTMLSDYIVEALKNKKRIKNRVNTLLLIKKQ